MKKRLFATALLVPAFAFVAGCQENTAPVSPTSTKVDNTKDVPPPTPAKPNAKGPSQGVVKGAD